jgi:DnaK suppressor protein
MAGNVNRQTPRWNAFHSPVSRVPGRDTYPHGIDLERRMLMEADPTVLAGDETRTANIRGALEERLAELRVEHHELVADMTTEERGLLIPDAGDDVVDIGTKTFTREQEISLVNAVRGRISQVERALLRLADGGYGWCESCGEAIPPARLAVYPSATLCVACKQLDERR